MSKVHLSRSMRSTWCGRYIHNASTIRVTEQLEEATCKTCLKADAAEIARNG
jgi:hypothetical protein